jgi:molybdopterin converting factor small subunit
VASVHLSAGLRAFAGGVDIVTIDAPHAHDLVTALGDRFPAMRPALEEMAVAIDGEIYAQPGYQPVRPDSEVHLLPRIAGGAAQG